MDRNIIFFINIAICTLFFNSYIKYLSMYVKSSYIKKIPDSKDDKPEIEKLVKKLVMRLKALSLAKVHIILCFITSLINIFIDMIGIKIVVFVTYVMLFVFIIVSFIIIKIKEKKNK